MRGVRALVLVISVAALSLPTHAMAAAPLYSYSNRGVSAYGDWDKCNRTNCWFLDLYAFQGTEKSADGPFKGTRVCLFGFGFSAGDSYITGCSQAPSGTLTVTKDLSAATLNSMPVEVEVCTFDYRSEQDICDSTNKRSMTVSAAWTGSGAAYSSSWRYTFTTGTCKETDAGKGTSRPASARATVDDVVFRPRHLEDAEISKGMERYRSTCEETF